MDLGLVNYYFLRILYILRLASVSSGERNVPWQGKELTVGKEGF